MQANDLWKTYKKPASFILIICLLGIGLGHLDIRSPHQELPRMFFKSSLGFLLLAFLYTSGTILTAWKNPKGWAILATFFFFLGQSLQGPAVFIFSTVAAACLWTWHSWKTKKFSNE